MKLRIAGVMLGVSGLIVIVAPALGPAAVLAVLLSGLHPWRKAWRACEGTSLRGALVWVALGLALGSVAQAVAWFESLDAGRPWTARITYLMVLAILAGLISVLGARNPGSGAWAILMVLLVVVFLIPWLEGHGRLHRVQGLVQLRLDSPWTLFYGLLVLAGVTNYLPTRYGPAAGCLGAGLVLEYLGLTRDDWAPSTRTVAWMGVGWAWGASIWLADRCAVRPSSERNSLEQLWFGFRDHWGVVWALRTQDRFNRTAELARWPIRLTWFGLVPTAPAIPTGSITVPPQAETTFLNLIRRFATAEGLEHLARRSQGQACHPGSLSG